MLGLRRVTAHRSLVLLVGLVACGGGQSGTIVYSSDGGQTDSGRDAGHVAMHDGGAGADVSVGKADAESIDATSHDAGTAHDASASHDAGSVEDSHATPKEGGIPEIAVVYGQSGAVLYSVDPITEAVTTIGLFFGCDSDVIDIALNANSVMYATTFGGVYTIDTTTAACTLVASGTTYPNSLSFVPAGTLDPSVEALVGYQGSTYVRIDTTSGAMSNVGALGGSTYSSSGDIVSVIGGGTYLTVTGGSDCSTNDCLVEVNPATGAIIDNLGSVKHPEVYGLAFWAGNVYGFDNAGDLFKVAFPDAGALVVTTIPIPDAPFGLSFNGAGSTTKAPRH